MIRIVILILVVCCLFSCKNTTEYIAFNHRNYMKVKSDEVIIKLIPKKKKNRPVIVKLIYHGDFVSKNKITQEEYNKIKSLILEIKQEDIELPKNIFTCGCGSNSISIKKDTEENKFYTVCLIKQFHGKFYDSAELILKSAKLNVKNID